jgi:hypothetical protein
MTDNQFDCEYCGAALPKGVNKNTRRIRSAHFMRHAAERKLEDSAVHFTAHNMGDKQPEALKLAADWPVLFKNGMLDAEDIQDITNEFCRLHALCDEMAAIVKSVASTILHTVPGEEDCRCSQCELAKEARVIYTKWKESK